MANMQNTIRKSDLLNILHKLCLKRSELDVLKHYIWRANNEWTCFPSNRDVAEKCALSVRAVQNASKSLLEKGLIKKEERFDNTCYGRQTSNFYTILINNIIDIAKNFVKKAKEKIEEIKDKFENKSSEDKDLDNQSCSEDKKNEENETKEETSKKAEFKGANVKNITKFHAPHETTAPLEPKHMKIYKILKKKIFSILK